MFKTNSAINRLPGSMGRPRNQPSGQSHGYMHRKAESDQDTISSAAHLREVAEAFLFGRAARLRVIDESGQTLGLLVPDDVQAARPRCVPIDIATARDALADNSS